MAPRGSARIATIIEHITAFGEGRERGQSIRCEDRPGQGRVLLAARFIPRGQLIFADSPLLNVLTPPAVAIESDNKDAPKLPESVIKPESKGAQRFLAKVRRFAMTHMGPGNLTTEREVATVWGALHSLLPSEVPTRGWPLPTCSRQTQNDALLLHTDRRRPSSATRKLHSLLRLRVSVAKFERLLDIWEMNSFEHSDFDDVSCLHLVPALANHSCMPTSNWYFDGLKWCLRANVDLRVGEELTVSYLIDDQLHMATPFRRAYIVETGKAFTCACPRCSGHIDRSRGVPCCRPRCGGTVFLQSPSAIGARRTAADLQKGAPSATVSSRSVSLKSVCNTCGQTLRPASQLSLEAAEAEAETLLRSLGPLLEEEGGHMPKLSCEDRRPASTIRSYEHAGPVLDRLLHIMLRHLGMSSHWMAWTACGLLRERASRGRTRGKIEEQLHYLDLRAAFVRRAYEPIEVRSERRLRHSCVPSPLHAMELKETAGLLLRQAKKRGSRGLATSQRNKSVRKARALLREALSICVTMFGQQSEETKGTHSLLKRAEVAGQGSAPIVAGKRRRLS